MAEQEAFDIIYVVNKRSKSHEIKDSFKKKKKKSEKLPDRVVNAMVNHAISII